MSASLKKKLKGNAAAASSSAAGARRLLPATGNGKSLQPGIPRALNDGSFADEMQIFQTGIKDESGRVKEFTVSHIWRLSGEDDFR
jgi:hypothetical protein